MNLFSLIDWLGLRNRKMLRRLSKKTNICWKPRAKRLQKAKKSFFMLKFNGAMYLSTFSSILEVWSASTRCSHCSLNGRPTSGVSTIFAIAHLPKQNWILIFSISMTFPHSRSCNSFMQFISLHRRSSFVESSQFQMCPRLEVGSSFLLHHGGTGKWLTTTF